MRLKLPRSLHYPITVTALLKRSSDHVDRLEPLFKYFYKTTVTEGDEFGEEHDVEKTFPTEYESPVEGVLRRWRIEKGTVITSPDHDIADIEEPCSHSVQYGGMCTLCGKDMTEITYNTDISNVDRATINMIHNNSSLTVSQDEATRVEQEAKRRLLKSKKLSLVVDLDQTIIHATVDPTVAEWQNDTSNPNYNAVKDVRAFQLVDDTPGAHGPGARGCWYYIKLRPGLEDFLKNISKIYELHIYTMGTRAYAQHIAAIVDPDRKIFGDRILSRDESGSLVAKNLQRLFPVDTKMVVIIDDRGDVWKWNENLLRVTPYDFFVGIGDINSSFLAKKDEMQTSTKALEAAVPHPNQDLADGAAKVEPKPDTQEAMTEASSTQTSQVTADSTKSDASTLDQLVSMGGGDDPSTLQRQVEQQDETLTAQLEDRPLLQQQKRLEEQEAAVSEEMSASEDGKEPAKDDQIKTEPTKPRHNLLQDDDTELRYLERSLTEVHRTFYEDYDNKLEKAQGGRVAQLRGEKPTKKLSSSSELDVVPDVATIMPQMKLRVLEGVVLVFSGVVPLGTDMARADIAIWALSFGAQIHEHISKRTTHLVAARNRTAKVRQAARRPAVRIVTTQWLTSSIAQWQRLPEGPYLIPVHPEDREPQPSSSSTAGKDAAPSTPSNYIDTRPGDNDSMLSSSEDDVGETSDDEEDTDTSKASRNGSLRINIVDDPDGVMPSDLTDENSPIDNFQNYDWKGVHEDLADFLGSDDDVDDDEDDSEMDFNNEDDNDDDASASDTNSITSSASNTSASRSSRRNRKRKRARSTDSIPTSNPSLLNGSALPPSPESQSRLAKRQQLARARTTSLKAVATLRNASAVGGEAGDEPAIDADMTSVASDVSGQGQDVEDDDDDGELERELAAEMERELDGGDIG